MSTPEPVISEAERARNELRVLIPAALVVALSLGVTGLLLTSPPDYLFPLAVAIPVLPALAFAFGKRRTARMLLIVFAMPILLPTALALFFYIVCT